MKKFLLTLALVIVVSPALARDAVQIPSGSYLELPDPEGQPLGFNGRDGTYGMGRYGECTIIKNSVKIDPAGVYSFDAKCVNTHGKNFISHEKWKLERAENGDTYLVTVSDAHGFSYSQTAAIAIWKLSKE